ncbi:casein kinase I-like [Contarinia nasturtii]|uniref:casein kinase I-like n=1 Tax=Contarinia nasturtii TaxID=265458 RepID=UPI0012D3F64C|nr:casein kinase I-like [Contarinia nasturtii]XP_031624044.1 casein kinase I-like [Contarinia nasturtii]XP_031624046.1 casein kinase I-like [Contarinia nasturtii]
MILIICYLLISGFPAIYGEIYSSFNVTDDINHYFAKGGKLNITGSREHELQLLKGESLGETKHAIVWKGLYNRNTNIAIKIFWNEELLNEEIKIYHALNATEDLNIESRGIPKVYYYGPFLEKYHAIAITLFDGTLRDRFKLQNGHLSDFSILLIFKQAVQTLEFIQSMQVVHNDIKPENIFLRDSNVFIGDFGIATFKGAQNYRCTPTFASSSFHMKENARYPIDDLESLVFTMWNIGNVPMDPSGEYEGYALCRSYTEGTTESRLLRKCEYFKNKDVRKAFELICLGQFLCSRKVPDYVKIIKILTKAIEKVSEKSGQVQFEWLSKGGQTSLWKKAFSRATKNEKTKN